MVNQPNSSPEPMPPKTPRLILNVGLKMKSHVFILFLLVAGCTSISPRDGTSRESSILIQTSDFHTAKRFEYAWLEANVRNAKRTIANEGKKGSQVFWAQIEHDDDRVWDVLSVVLEDGSVRKVYFDVTKCSPDLLRILKSQDREKKETPSQSSELAPGRSSS